MKPLATFLTLGTVMAAPSLTIYNQDFAVVRQEIPMKLQAGINEISFDQVTAQLEPDSVVLRDPSGKLEFQILEQSYRNDPVSVGLMLQYFEGQEISFLVEEENGDEKEKVGKVVRSGYASGLSLASGFESSEPIIEVDGKLQFGLPGKPLFPSLGDDSILRPTLSWALNSKSSEGTAELSYLSSGFSWKADYNLVVPEGGGEECLLNGWLTLSNSSGARFEEASVSLLAGDVNRIQEERIRKQSVDPFADYFAGGVEETVVRKELGSYHLYTVARPVSLRDQETKQVEFLESAKVRAIKSYLYAPLKGKRTGSSASMHHGKKNGFSKDVGIYWSFENTTENGLGVPLPGGKIRLYQQSDSKLEFTGENKVDHTPQKEVVEIFTGNAFDLVGERRVVNFEHHDHEKYMLETIELKLRNRSKGSVTIDTQEPMWRWSKWTIVESSTKYEKLDQGTLQFTSELEPDEEAVITFTVRYDY